VAWLVPNSLGPGLVAGHGHLKILLGWDEVAMVVVAQVDLDPADGAGVAVVGLG